MAPDKPNNVLRLFDDVKLATASRANERVVTESAKTPTDIPSAAKPEGNIYQAQFAFDLTAAEMLVPEQENGFGLEPALLHHLLCTLQEGQKLNFVYGVRPDARDGKKLSFRIEGSATAALHEAALQQSHSLSRSVSSLLESRRDCRFTASEPATDVWKHHYKAIFQGTALERRANLKSAPLHAAEVQLPALNLLRYNPGFFETLLSCKHSLEIAVSVARRALDARQQKILAETRFALLDNGAKCVSAPAGGAVSSEQLIALTPIMASQISRWIAEPAGFELLITARSLAPVEKSSLQMLVQALVPARKISVICAQEDSRNKKILRQHHSLKLNSCFNETEVLPALLPPFHILQRMGLAQAYAPTSVGMSDTGIVLGKAGDALVRIPDTDRSRHCYVVGATGSGKTTLLYNMIVQDIEAGRGVCLIDPHGDLYRDVLRAIPNRRADDVSLLDPTDSTNIPGLNYLEVPGSNPGYECNFVVSEMMKIFERLYDMREAGGPMFETYMRNALLLLMESRIAGLTLLEVPLLFEDADFRNHLIKNCTNSGVRNFWTKIASRARTDASLDNIAPYIVSKLNQFTHNALLRAIVGQSRSTFNFIDILDNRKILLVNLARGVLGDMDSSLLGMLVTSKLFGAALSRVNRPSADRVNFSLYIDECQNYVTDIVAQLLSEARKFGLQAVLANQHLAQIDVGNGRANLMRSVLGNVGNILAMRVGILDARLLQDIFGKPISSDLLQELPDFHVAGRILQQGRPSKPFVFQTLPPVTPATAKSAQQTIQRNHVRHHSQSHEAIALEIHLRQQFNESQPD